MCFQFYEIHIFAIIINIIIIMNIIVIITLIGMCVLHIPLPNSNWTVGQPAEISQCAIRRY